MAGDTYSTPRGLRLYQAGSKERQRVSAFPTCGDNMGSALEERRLEAKPRH